MIRLTHDEVDRIIKKYMPQDWTLSYDPYPGFEAQGCACFDNKIIHIPDSDSLYTILIFLHEVAHIKKRHAQQVHKLPHWFQEYECERFAIQTAKKEGLVVSDYVLEQSKRYVRKGYRRYRVVCKLYDLKHVKPPTKAQLEWMGWTGR